MASFSTANYQLCQWEPADQVQRTDFNADNAKIDAALSELAADMANKASLSALSSVQASMPRVAVGTYTGNGTASRKITLSFTPKAVLVLPQKGPLYESGSVSRTYGGLAVTGSNVLDGQGTAVVSIVSNGFQVAYYESNSYTHAASNQSGTVYHYFAIG